MLFFLYELQLILNTDAKGVAVKKLLTMISVLFFSNPVLAEDSFSFSSYAGVSGGININTGHIDQSMSLEATDIVRITPSGDFDTNHFGPIGQLQFGAGFNTEAFYLGAELSGQLFDGDFDTVSTSFNDSVPSVQTTHTSQLQLNNFEIALDFKPGFYLYENTLIYGRIGIAANELELSENVQTFQELTNEEINIQSQNTEDVYPLRLGVGVERRFNDDWSILIDYIYTRYGDISTQAHNNDVIPPLVIVESSTKATDISRQVVMLGFNYYL